MKKTFNFWKIIAIVLITFFIVSACSSDTPDPYSGVVPEEFLGTWNSSTDSIIFYSNSYKLINLANNDFEIVENLSFTPISNSDINTNTEFPSGYDFTGKITDATGNWSQFIGQNVLSQLFLNIPKSKFIFEGEVFSR